jgi:hypothetical protein
MEKKMKNIIQKAFLLSIGFVSVNAASAATTISTFTIPTGWYAGGSVGAGNSSCSTCGKYSGNSASSSALSLNLHAGYDFNSYIAAELGNTWLPNIVNNEGGSSSSYNVSAITLAAKGTYPLKYYQNVSVFGKLGAALVGIGSNLLGSDTSATGLYYAVGANYAFKPQIQF